MSTNLNTQTKAETTTGAALFPLGQTLITPGAQEAIRDAGQVPLQFLLKHQAGDWGEVCQEDRRENELSLKEGFRLLSAYRTKAGVKIWLITEWDRSATTILLPSEY
jgi:hypothetical protein